MNDEQLLRYSRHILLNEIGIEGQQKIGAAEVILVGAGGLGSAAAFYLAAAGVGKLTVIDDDHVDLTNLQRQILYTQDQLGASKAESARATLKKINPEVEVVPVMRRIDEASLQDYLTPSTMAILDCSDNFETRQALNRVCLAKQIPLISGAAIKFSGQVSTFDFRQTQSACYACVFSNNAQEASQNCATMGVFAPLVGMVGTLQAAEALKVITQSGQLLSGRLLTIDAFAMRWTEVELERDLHCPVCAEERSNH